MKKTYLYIVIATFCVSSAISQSYLDAARYSNTYSGVTARLVGAGNAFGALGGDIGVLAINPAGLADFKKSEFSFTFAFNQGNTNSILRGSGQSTSHNVEPSIDNIGFVISNNSRGWLGRSNFAIGLQQHGNLNEDFAFSGTTSGSITERFTELSNTRTPDELDNFEAGLAFESGAIYDFDGDLFYDADIDTMSLVDKSQSINRSGNVNEIYVALGGKINSNFGYGISLGFPIISYEEERAYFENDRDDNVAIFDRLNFDERFTTTGWGYNVKLGLNYTVKKTLRLGLAYHSPNFYKLNDTYNTTVGYAFTDAGVSEQFSSDSPDGNFQYRFRTPSRIIGSLGALLKFNKVRGFLNVDAQYVNFQNNRFNFTAFSDNPIEAQFEEDTNQEIEELLASALNVNIGGELAFQLNDQTGMRVRAGYGLVQSPIESESAGNVLSFGLGYRKNKMFIDLAYQRRDFTSTHIPFRILNESREQVVTNDTEISKVSITMGFKL